MCCAGAQASAGLPVSLASCGGSFAKLSSVPGHAHSLKAQPSRRVQKCLFLPHVSFTPHLVSTSYVPYLPQRWGVSAMGSQRDCCWGPCVWGKGSHHDLNPSFVLVEEHRSSLTLVFPVMYVWSARILWTSWRTGWWREFKSLREQTFQPK